MSTEENRSSSETTPVSESQSAQSMEQPEGNISGESTDTGDVVTDRDGGTTVSDGADTAVDEEADPVSLTSESDNRESINDEHTITDNNSIIDEILSDKELVRGLESRLFSSRDNEIRYNLQLKHTAEDLLDRWLKVKNATDPVFNPENFNKAKLAIEEYTKEANEYAEKINRLQSENTGGDTSHAAGEARLLQCRDELYDRDIIISILIIMFPQIEWVTLQSIFNRVVNSLGIPTIGEQKANRFQSSINNDQNAQAQVQPSILEESFMSALDRIDARVETREIGGHTIDVVCFDSKHLPEIDNFIRQKHRDIAITQIIPILFDIIITGPDLSWEDRRQIGHAIGGFMKHGAGYVFNLLTSTWAISNDLGIRAASGFILTEAVESGLSRESIFVYLKDWVNTGDIRLQWTSASVCKEIGKADIDVALNCLQYVLKKQRTISDLSHKKYLLDAVIYSLVVLGLSGFYRDVLTKLSQWVVSEQDKNLKKIQVDFFQRMLDVFLGIIKKELLDNGKEGIVNQKNLGRKSVEALWLVFTQSMDDKIQKTIINVFASVIRSASNPEEISDFYNILISQINVNLLANWLDAFSDKDNERTYEPEVREIITNLLVELYKELESSDNNSEPISETRSRQPGRRSGNVLARVKRKPKRSDYQEIFWFFLKPWEERPIGDIKHEVYNAVSRRLGIKGRRAVYSASTRERLKQRRI